MRVLNFVVEGDYVKPGADCDFSGLFPGKENEVLAVFSFSPEWEHCAKVVAFWSILGKEYPPQLLVGDDSCLIPVEALARPAFRMQLLRKQNGSIISTNRLTIYQKGGKV